MKKGVWDLCQLDPHFLSDLDEFSTLVKYETQGNIILNEEPEKESLSSSKVARADGFQHGLSQAEESGRVTLQNLDSVIQILHQMRSAYDDVTGRTNSLVSKCENLLEQQVLSSSFLILMCSYFTYVFNIHISLFSLPSA